MRAAESVTRVRQDDTRSSVAPAGVREKVLVVRIRERATAHEVEHDHQLVAVGDLE